MEIEHTTDKLSLVQPNSVTNARYDYTAIQENVITCIIDAVQGQLTKEKPIETDLFGNPTIRVKASELAQNRNKIHVMEQLRELRKKDIDFCYVNPKGQTEEVITGLINTVRSVKESDFIEIEISRWAIPYLLYWGKGIGGTIFRKSLALTLKGIYAKRMYKLCCRWEDKGGFAMSIDELRTIFGLEKKYNRITDLQKRVLDPAQKEMKERADLYFEYSLEKVKSKTYNSINFKIFSTQNHPNDNLKDWYLYVYHFLCRTYPNYKSDKAKTITEKLAEDSSKLRLAYGKFQKLDDDFTTGKKKTEDIIKLTKYILKSDFEMK